MVDENANRTRCLVAREKASVRQTVAAFRCRVATRRGGYATPSSSS